MALHEKVLFALSALRRDPGDFAPDQTAVPDDVLTMFNKLLGFASWTVTGLCIAGLLVVAGRMAISHRRGEGGEHATGLAWVGGACLLIGTATPIVTGLLTAKG